MKFMGPAELRSHWTGVLWDEDLRRICPTVAAFDAHNDWEAMLFTACHPEVGRAIFFIPTVEWVERMVRFLALIGARRVLEVGAGDGFLTQCLREAAPGIDFVASDTKNPESQWGIDYPEWVEQEDALESVLRVRPDLVIWAWPPLGSDAMELVIRSPWCPLYLEIGEGPGGCTGNEETSERFSHRSMRYLAEHGRCRTDNEITCRHTWCGLYPGRAHPGFREYQLTEGEYGGVVRGEPVCQGGP